MRALLLAALLSVAPAAVAAQATHLLVVVGLGGDDAHRDTFHGWATALIDAAKERGVDPDRIRYLGAKPEIAPSSIAGRSTREEIEAAVLGIANDASSGDEVMIVLIGHGSARGGDARFNLPGPDMEAEDFALLLDQLTGQRVTFVNTASSSGGFAPVLAGPGRTIITATRTSREQNETVFARYFVSAFSGEDADLDKDGRVSVLEAYQYASHEVERHYADEGLLQTEHARLVDDWDGDVADVEDTPPEDARLAASTVLRGTVTGGPVPASASPELVALYAKRDSLQGRVEELRGVREAMDAADYEARLEELLVEIGLLTREIRQREGGP